MVVVVVLRQDLVAALVVQVDQVAVEEAVYQLIALEELQHQAKEMLALVAVSLLLLAELLRLVVAVVLQVLPQQELVVLHLLLTLLGHLLQGLALAEHTQVVVAQVELKVVH